MYIVITVVVIASACTLLGTIFMPLLRKRKANKLRAELIDFEFSILKDFSTRVDDPNSAERASLLTRPTGSNYEFFKSFGLPTLQKSESAYRIIKKLFILAIHDKNYAKYLRPFLSVLAEWRSNSPRGNERLILGDSLLSWFSYFSLEDKKRIRKELNFDEVAISKAMKRVQLRLLEPLLKKAEDDISAFEEARSLILKHQCIRGLDIGYPDNWDELVAKHVRLPALKDFGIFWNDRFSDTNPGELLLMAAEALEEEDIGKAKLVMAYANNSAEYRAQLGDLYVTGLTRFIARYEKAKLKKIQEAVH